MSNINFRAQIAQISSSGPLDANAAAGAGKVFQEMSKLGDLFKSGKTSDDVQVNDQWTRVNAEISRMGSLNSGAPVSSQPGTFSGATASSSTGSSSGNAIVDSISHSWDSISDTVGAIQDKVNSLQEEAMKLMADPKTAAQGQMKMAQAQAMSAALSNFIATLSKMMETAIRASAPS